MLDQTNNLPRDVSEVLGDLTALAEQLGTENGLCQLAPILNSALDARPIQDGPGLRKFLEDYAFRVLIPHELPAIARAYDHVSRYETRELLALDKQLGGEAIRQRFADTSRRVGRMQLLRLRPLRGERVVARYLKAIEAGEANGWHTLVFGLVLAVYSMPLRQGLVHYGQQTLGGFVDAASARLNLAGPERREIVASQASLIREAVEGILAPRSLMPTEP